MTISVIYNTVLSLTRLSLEKNKAILILTNSYDKKKEIYLLLCVLSTRHSNFLSCLEARCGYGLFFVSNTEKVINFIIGLLQTILFEIRRIYGRRTVC